MSKKRLVILIVSVVLVAAGVLAIFVLKPRTSKTEAGPDVETVAQVKGFELLSNIPSDACGVICCERLSEGMETLFDSGSIFRELNFGPLSSEKLVISYHWMGELVPMIAVPAGRGQTPTSEVEEIIAKAAERGLEARYIASDSRMRKGVLLISPSYAIIDSAERHMEAHTSVLEVDGLVEALQKAPSKGDVVIFRNDMIGNLLPRDFLANHLPRKQVVKFINGFSSWTVLHLKGSELAGRGEYLSYDVRSVTKSDMSQWGGMMAAQACEDSKVASLLPMGTVFVIDQSIANVSEYLEARKKVLDASGGLNNYNNALAKLQKSSGANPAKWAEEIDIREVARVKWKKEEVLLVRPAKPLTSHDIKPNKYNGYLSVLFGSAYSIPDETNCACIGNWLIFGSRDAVKHFLASEQRQKTHNWPTKNVKLVLLADDCQVNWTKNGLEFNYYRTY